MTELTKKWLKKEIANIETSRDEIPFGVGEYWVKILQALKLALASMEAPRVAEPVENGAWSGWCCQYPGKMPRLYGAKEIAEVNHYPEQGDRLFKVVEVADAAPHAPVAPAKKTMPDVSQMFVHDAVNAIAKVHGWNECVDAMLKGEKS